MVDDPNVAFLFFAEEIGFSLTPDEAWQLFAIFVILMQHIAWPNLIRSATRVIGKVQVILTVGAHLQICQHQILHRIFNVRNW